MREETTERTGSNKRRLRKTPIVILLIVVLAAAAVFQTVGGKYEIGHSTNFNIRTAGQEAIADRLYIGEDFVNGTDRKIVLPIEEYETLYAEYLENRVLDTQEFAKEVARGNEEGTFLRNGGVYSVKGVGKKVAITFDDGPYPKKLDKYLKILADSDVKATFFCLGQYVQSYPEAAQKIVDGGHELASHSWSHAKLTTLAQPDLSDDFAKTEAAFMAAVGFEPYLFRPPYGAQNPNLINTAGSYGQLTVLWSVDTLDWKAKSAQQVVNRTMSAVHDGAIILMHENKDYTIEALPKIICALKKNGYEIVPVGELIYETYEKAAGAKND